MFPERQRFEKRFSRFFLNQMFNGVERYDEDRKFVLTNAFRHSKFFGKRKYPIDNLQSSQGEGEEKMEKKILGFVVSMIFLFAVVGCASYYKIVDPVSKNVYYTQSIDKMGNGVIQFKDQASKNKVTLPQSEIMEVTEDQFMAGTRGQ